MRVVPIVHEVMLRGAVLHVISFREARVAVASQNTHRPLLPMTRPLHSAGDANGAAQQMQVTSGALTSTTGLT